MFAYLFSFVYLLTMLIISSIIFLSTPIQHDNQRKVLIK
ncbi:hypothetical protein JC2156_11620 [Weissella koreensis KCTC 3621]|nr:hypothetical protein JC2156_11620 [Weissella koreensis KCTC 3621]